MKDLFDLINKYDNIKKVDFHNKESVDNYINTIKSIKDNYNSYVNNDNSLFGKFVSETFSSINNICDNLIENAENKYNEYSQKNFNKEYNAETNNEKDKLFPSSLVSDKVLKRISDLAIEYVDKEVKPYANISDNERKITYECLIEFACWVYNHK